MPSSRPTTRALASSDKPLDRHSTGDATGVPRGDTLPRRAFRSLGSWRSDGAARWVFIWPSVILILLLSIFPLVASLTLAFTRLVFKRGSIDINFVGLTNFSILLGGTEQTHLLGALRAPTPLGWLILGVVAAFTIRAFIGSVRRRNVSPFGMLLRLIAAFAFMAVVGLVVATLFGEGGRPGSLVVTLVYVFAGIVVQYLLGLGLAILAVQPLAGRRFFRIVFLLPLTITPVGVGYMFRMMTDTGKGPLAPLFGSIGLHGATWVNDPWLARIAVIIGDAWQWTPFVFIVLLAALEGLDQEVKEAALVDGSSAWQTFRHITFPAILPVSSTIILIRLIEGFKIVDMPNILTGGGPGTATQSLTLQAYLDWRTLNLGGSAAIAYILLILVTIIASVYVGWARRRIARGAL
jgi:multiple sugar transport system permease protein